MQHLEHCHIIPSASFLLIRCGLFFVLFRWPIPQLDVRRRCYHVRLSGPIMIFPCNMRSQWVWHRKPSWNANRNQYFHDPAKTCVCIGALIKNSRQNNLKCNLCFYGAICVHMVIFHVCKIGCLNHWLTNWSFIRENCWCDFFRQVRRFPCRKVFPCQVGVTSAVTP